MIFELGCLCLRIVPFLHAHGGLLLQSGAHANDNPDYQRPSFLLLTACMCSCLAENACTLLHMLHGWLQHSGSSRQTVARDSDGFNNPASSGFRFCCHMAIVTLQPVSAFVVVERVVSHSTVELLYLGSARSGLFGCMRTPSPHRLSISDFPRHPHFLLLYLFISYCACSARKGHVPIFHAQNEFNQMGFA